MLDDTIARLEARLRDSGSLAAENREELLSLLRQLKQELATLEATHSEEARDITDHTERFTAAAGERQPDVVKSSFDELAESVAGFENSHPQLVQIVNRIATTLSNLGI
jgi:ABC-type transporter Mla subunit MlaD